MKKKVNYEDERPDPTPDRQRERPSGWCSTGHHETCPRFFSFGICGCDCDHKGQRKWIPPEK